MEKNKNQFTINLNDALKRQIIILADAYQRKPADLLRLLVTPAIINAYADLQRLEHPTNAQPMQPAIFKEV